MKFLSDRYAKVFTHKGFDVCTLKLAVPSDGDHLGYVIDDKSFGCQLFDLAQDAIDAIDAIRT
jgi:hypothetical protein